MLHVDVEDTNDRTTFKVTKSPSNTDKLERRNRELVILNAIAGEMNRPVDLDQSLRTALALVAELLDLRTGWIFLLDPESGVASLAASQNLPPGLADDPEAMEGSCYCLDTYRDGDLSGAANVNVVRCSRLRWIVEGNDGLRYHSSIPLYAYGRKLGVLNVASTDWRELSQDDLRILYTIGDLLSIAIERARLFDQSRRLGAAEERNRIAREIHDTLAQGLAAVALRLEMADALIESGADSEAVRNALRQGLDLTRSNLQEARRSVLELRAAPLEGRTLPEALSSLAAALSGDGLEVTFNATTSSIALPTRLELGIYRIAQESLRNVELHAKASHVSVDLTSDSEAITLVVEDDGCGFNPEAIPQGHYGLVGLNERVRLLGGTLTIESTPSEGTRIEATIPIA
jgi:two-component system NarL family sensor kinase